MVKNANGILDSLSAHKNLHHNLMNNDEFAALRAFSISKYISRNSICDCNGCQKLFLLLQNIVVHLYNTQCFMSGIQKHFRLNLNQDYFKNYFYILQSHDNALIIIQVMYTQIFFCIFFFRIMSTKCHSTACRTPKIRSLFLQLYFLF